MRSEEIYPRAVRLMPGGVNSPVRSFKSVGGVPRFIERAEGDRIFDVDGREYVDYVMSWGPSILGHAHGAVVEAVRRAAGRGLTFGAATEAEVEIAETVSRLMPSMETLRLVNSGTEAVLSAVRLARAFTGRGSILLFKGCYHGHSDSVVASAGVPPELAALTVHARYNDAESVEAAFRERGGDIAAIVVEPVAANCGVIPPATGFLEALRGIADRHGALLVFDEVITGFRLGLGGAQERYGVRPDLTTLGKIVGGGLPCGAFGGRRDIMRMIAPDGPVYQAGTLSGNPLTVAAGLATLRFLEENPQVYAKMERQAEALEAAFAGRASTGRAGSLIGATFPSDADYARFFNAMLERGFYFAPAPREAIFLSAAHTDEDVERTCGTIREVL